MRAALLAVLLALSGCTVYHDRPRIRALEKKVERVEGHLKECEQGQDRGSDAWYWWNFSRDG